MNHDQTINTKTLSSLLRKGESETIEFKRSTGEMKEAMQTLCAFLNATGGTVLFGIKPDATIEGQDVSDRTLREIAHSADRLEPPAHVSIHRIKTVSNRNVVAVAVEGGEELRPFVYEGHAYERVGSTTRRMPQSKYERLLIERGHSKRRWENLPAEGLALKDLDRKEILRTRELAIQQNRISPDTGSDIGEILDRLGLRVGGVLTQAAHVLYGKRFLPNYPQCFLKLGRFRGTEITGEIVDNRLDHMNAFSMVRESMAFLERTMPLGARFPKGQIFREDRFPVPLDALREIVLNAVMHRDYSHYSGYVAIAVFDDRIEIQSYGRLPNGITVEQLSGPHRSKPTNPLIAEAFHRTGAVEIWGRGTNRVIAMCKQHGIAEPTFEEREGYLIVTFKAQMAPAAVAMADNLADKVADKLAAEISESVLQILSANPEMTLKQVAAAIKKPYRSVERAIATMVCENRLLRVGGRKNGYWEVHHASIAAMESANIIPTSTEMSVAMSDKMSVEMSGKMAGKKTAEISERILQLLGENPELTLAQVASAIGKTRRTVERLVSRLVHKGKLKRTGSRKNGFWETQYISEATADERKIGYGAAPERSLKNLPVKTTVQISESIIRTLGKYPEMTLAQVASAVGKSLRTVERAAANMVDEGKLKHVGPRKGGRWIIIRRTSRPEKRRK